MKRLLLPAALLALSLFSLPTAAFADPNPANDSDSVVVRIRPAADLGVDIDTANVTLAFTMDMGATQYTLTPATVTILGNISPQELDIQGGNNSADPVWSLDTDEAAAIDELQLYALFATGRTAPPSEAEFAGVKNLITTSVKRAGTAGGSAADQNFENNSMSGGADMDSLAVGTQRQLWLRMDAPPYTSTTSEQSFTVTVTATRTGM
jgi:hypothetical protein